MSHPNPGHDRENEYPTDNYKPVSKKHMARKMSRVDKLKKLVKESQQLRHSFFRGGMGGGGLPPGYNDKDNE